MHLKLKIVVSVLFDDYCDRAIPRVVEILLLGLPHASTKFFEMTPRLGENSMVEGDGVTYFELNRFGLSVLKILYG